MMNYPNLNLVVQIVMGLALLVGWALARKKNYTAHKYCQSSVMLLNLVMIFLVMSPSFHRQVQPQIPQGLNDPYYLVALIHAGLGTIAELLGLYIVLVAATNLVPKKLRFDNYKPWMRTELALWWAVLLFGFGVYYYWYVHQAPVQPTTSMTTTETQKTAPNKVTIKLTNFKFEPKEITVKAGTTVEWIDEIGKHTIEADDDAFKSEVLPVGGRFEHTFNAPGTFPYFCGLHGEKGGHDMAGVVKVEP
ncbi:MAG: DUF420 domain-containing protein [Acidobacteriota bacterium]